MITFTSHISLFQEFSKIVFHFTFSFQSLSYPPKAPKQFMSKGIFPQQISESDVRCQCQNSIFQLFGQIISFYYYIYYLLYLFIYIYFVSFSPPYLYIVLQLNNNPVPNRVKDS